MKILLFGKNGQVGWSLQRALAPLGTLVACGRSEVDFADPKALKAFLIEQDCDVIVNAAAYTAVDQAESEPALAKVVNEASIAILAADAAARNCWLVHYSTDYVFDGSAPDRYLETDAPNPLSVYGTTKWRAEMAIAASGCRHLIFRTSWVHSARGRNFISTILDLANTRHELRVTADQVGAPTSADLVADVTAHALHQAVKEGDSASGTYHLSASGEISWHEYARWLVTVAPAMGFQLVTKPDRVIPITMAEHPRAARRPTNCTLDTSKLLRRFALHMPNWEDGVLRTMQELAEARR
ncbi:dTDP-4-dehydrorhamnose reductase [uncultured Devosia sp.]|uniref:dTDP-4-dehydrorhamnose reductase n=1 Tax=uncultured Devosia sp. TaxID=211434 RepID=UPI0035C95A8D